MVVYLLKAREQVFKKYWALPELRHLFSVQCELKGPFLILTMTISHDAKHERVSAFKSIRVTEKVSGKDIFSTTDEDAPGALSSDNVMINDSVRLVRRVSNMVEDHVRIEGIMTIIKRTSSRSKEVGPGRDIAFETCV